MSVKVLNEDYFKRIGKYLSLTNNDAEVKRCLELWHELNLRNYVDVYAHHGEVFDGLLFDCEAFDFELIPIPSAVQVLSDMRVLHYNCVDYGAGINETMLGLLETHIKRVEHSSEYEATKAYRYRVAY